VNAVNVPFQELNALAAQDAMEGRARIFAIALGVIVLLFVVNLVRTKKLSEEFALLWLFTAVVLVLSPLFIDYLDRVAYAIGIEYPPALIFLLAIISLLLILFQFSMRLSRYSDQIKVLTQEIALLSLRVAESEKRLASAGVRDSAGQHGVPAERKLPDDGAEAGL
jgi:hypothetical protein